MKCTGGFLNTWATRIGVGLLCHCACIALSKHYERNSAKIDPKGKVAIHLLLKAPLAEKQLVPSRSGLAKLFKAGGVP